MHITPVRVVVDHQDAVRPSRKTALHQIVILSESFGDQSLTRSGKEIDPPHEEAEDVQLVIVDILLHLCWTIGNTLLRTISVLTFIEGMMDCVPHSGVEVKARHAHSNKLAALACGEAADGAIASITACGLCTRIQVLDAFTAAAKTRENMIIRWMRLRTRSNKAPTSYQGR